MMGPSVRMGAKEMAAPLLNPPLRVSVMIRKDSGPGEIPAKNPKLIPKSRMEGQELTRQSGIGKPAGKDFPVVLQTESSKCDDLSRQKKLDRWNQTSD